MKILLDTHVWIWWHLKPENLSSKVLELIADNKNYDEILLSSISLWEFCKLVEKNKIILACSTQDWLKEALNIAKLRIVEISPAIAYQSTILPQPFHQDPADQIIVATARSEKALLLTKDEKILQYKHVQAVW